MTTLAMETTMTMRAAVQQKYGSFELKEVARPALPDDRILVRVHAASLNKLDWYELTGIPAAARVMTGLRGPKSTAMGHDFAGTVEAVGSEIEGFRPGDEVFGASTGALAEVVRTRIGWVAPKPANLTFEEAAAVPIAAMTALQGLRDHGQLEPGQAVLVNGASGGVGTFGVQIAKALGAEVTAVCSTRNVEQARDLGADRVLDYTRDDVTRGDRRFDVILHVGGRMSWRQCRRVLNPQGRLVLAGASSGSSFAGPLGYIGKIRVASLRGSQKATFFISKFNRADLDVLRELIEAGKVRPVVEKVYGFDEAAAALRHLGEGHARGKIVVSV